MKRQEEPKRLYRSKKEKMVAGVCGGIAEYFNIDPVWVRVIAVLTIFVEGIGLLLYLAAWILIPKNPYQNEKGDTKAEEIAKKAINEVNKGMFADKRHKGHR